MKVEAASAARCERALGVVAGLCGIHCLLTPVLVAAVPFLALSETVEWGVMSVSVSLGLALVVLGPRRDRGRVLAVSGMGATLWLSSLLGWLEPLPETVTSGAGSLVFAGALLWSTRPCSTDACERCEGDEGVSS